MSLVAAALFVLSFATSYAALYDYALQLDFGREFAVVFSLVLDAVISVLAVTVLLEQALRRRTITIKGWRVTDPVGGRERVPVSVCARQGRESVERQRRRSARSRASQWSRIK